MMTHALLLTLILAGADPAVSETAESATTATFVDIPKLVDEAERSYLVQRWDRAIDKYQQAVAANPTVGYLWYRLGTCCLLGKQYETAVDAFTKAHELGAYEWHPVRIVHRGEAAWGVAAAHARLGNRDDAIRWTKVSLDEGLRDIREFHKPHFKTLLEDDEFRRLVWADKAKKLSRDEGFRHDLRFAMHEAKRIHYDPFRITSEAELDSMAAALDADIPNLTYEEIHVRMMAIMRRLGDGHTHIRRNDKPRRLAIHFYHFPEGLYIDAALEAHADLVGARVLKIGDVAAGDAYERARDITSHDNEMNIRAVAPRLLESVALLSGMGIWSGEGPVPLEVEDAAGKQRTVEISIVERGIPDHEFIYDVPGCDTPQPLCLQHRDKPYWFETLPEERLVFFQFNSVGNAPDESFADFCGRLFEEVAKPEVDALVIDMRYNGGGNTFLNVPMIEGIIRSEKLQKRGNLFVIIGRRTFSAAQNTTTELERRTQAILVGEPTGSNPNFIGESIVVRLPYSGWVMSPSDLWWQHSMPMDYRVWTHPQLYAPPTVETCRQHRDPAMEQIRAYRASSAADEAE